MNSLIPYKGAAKTGHIDARSTKYKKDQARQRRIRGEARWTFQSKRPDILAQHPEHENLSLEFVVDRMGTDINQDAFGSLIKTMWSTRGFYLIPRKDRLEKLRRVYLRQWETYVIEIATGSTLRRHQRGANLKYGRRALQLKAGEEKVRVEVPRDKVTVVFYEALNQAPWHSWALVEAAKRGLQPIVLRFLRELGKELIPIAEKSTGCEAVACPYHPKVWAGHFQVPFVCVNADNVKIGSFDWSHLGRAMLGAWRLREFGYRGKKLDEITGEKDSEAGIEEAIADRGDKSPDYLLAVWLDRRTEELLQTPEFVLLRPYFAKGRDAYHSLKTEELREIAEIEGSDSDSENPDSKSPRDAVPEYRLVDWTVANDALDRLAAGKGRDTDFNYLGDKFGRLAEQACSSKYCDASAFLKTFHRLRSGFIESRDIVEEPTGPKKS